MIWYDVDAALAAVPINISALIDDTDFKTREESVVYNQAGLDLVWNFVTTAGAYTQTAVTPTDTAGNYDFINKGNGMYSIEIPASGGASINNDTEGFGWFTGFATGILPWTGPVCGFRAAELNNSLIDAGTTGLLAPTTAARTLDVTATGAAGIDWANVENPTTALDLTGTNIKTDQKVDVNTIKTNPVVNAGTVTFPTTATLASTTNITAGTITTTTNLTNLPAAAALEASVQTLTTTVGAAGAGLTAIGDARIANLDAAMTTRATPAQVNAEVLDVLNVDTFVQPGQGTPAATTTIRLMLSWLYKAWRNRTTQTATEYDLFNDDAVTVDSKATFNDDGTTADRGEVVTGP